MVRLVYCVSSEHLAVNNLNLHVAVFAGCRLVFTLVLCAPDGVLYGPMHSQQGVELYKQAIKDAQAQGGKVEFGGKVSQHLLGT